MTRVKTVLDACPDEFTASMRLVAVVLADTGRATSADLAERTGVSQPTMDRALSALVEAGLAREAEPLVDGNPGRNPVVYVATPPTDDDPELTSRQLKDCLVCELARLHYRSRVSSATTKRLRKEVPGVSGQAIGAALRHLEADGVVEQVSLSSFTTRWRLVGAETVAPFTTGEVQ